VDDALLQDTEKEKVLISILLKFHHSHVYSVSIYRREERLNCV
jgi:hypothetical protein